MRRRFLRCGRAAPAAGVGARGLSAKGRKAPSERKERPPSALEATICSESAPPSVATHLQQTSVSGASCTSFAAQIARGCSASYTATPAAESTANSVRGSSPRAAPALFSPISLFSPVSLFSPILLFSPI